jgi:hypothetical protein
MVQERTEENHIIHEQSQVTFIKSSHLHFIGGKQMIRLIIIPSVMLTIQFPISYQGEKRNWKSLPQWNSLNPLIFLAYSLINTLS